MLLFKHFCSKIKEPGNGRSNSVENYIKNYAHFSAIENWKQEQDKMMEEEVDVEYLSLHGYIRNTPSDTEVHAEHQLRADRSTWPVEKDV